MCVCVFVYAEGTPVQAAGRRAHTQKKKSGWVCEEGERETASQMNQPTNQVKQRAYVCVKKK